ncbi:hypothetical protein [Ruegeria atlantica]|uniref:hypothetical protein n=1 Tax=Ruegeria atlantica TaxID=81569 RepID=UPI00147FF2FD|nr:hypothetical protein [Ruegeria atlantica]
MTKTSNATSAESLKAAALDESRRSEALRQQADNITRAAEGRYNQAVKLDGPEARGALVEVMRDMFAATSIYRAAAVAQDSAIQLIFASDRAAEIDADGAEAQDAAKFTYKAVDDARAFLTHRDGKAPTQRQIAAFLGCSQGMISKLIRAHKAATDRGAA